MSAVLVTRDQTEFGKRFSGHFTDPRDDIGIEVHLAGNRDRFHRVCGIGMCALEAKLPFEDRVFDEDAFEKRLLDDEGLFFLHQCITALFYLTDVQHCDVGSIDYAGVFHGKHVWMGRT